MPAVSMTITPKWDEVNYRKRQKFGGTLVGELPFKAGNWQKKNWRIYCTANTEQYKNR